MARKRVLLAEINADAVKTANEDWLASDFQTSGKDSYCEITIGVKTAVNLNLTPNTGSAIYFNNSAAVAANAVHTFTVQLDPARTWNVQTQTAGGCTVSLLRIVEVFDP